MAKHNRGMKAVKKFFSGLKFWQSTDEKLASQEGRLQEASRDLVAKLKVSHSPASPEEVAARLQNLQFMQDLTDDGLIWESMSELGSGEIKFPKLGLDSELMSTHKMIFDAAAKGDYAIIQTIKESGIFDIRTNYSSDLKDTAIHFAINNLKYAETPEAMDSFLTTIDLLLSFPNSLDLANQSFKAIYKDLIQTHPSLESNDQYNTIMNKYKLHLNHEYEEVDDVDPESLLCVYLDESADSSLVSPCSADAQDRLPSGAASSCSDSEDNEWL